MKGTLKKLVCLILVLCFMAGIVACSKEENYIVIDDVEVAMAQGGEKTITILENGPEGYMDVWLKNQEGTLREEDRTNGNLTRFLYYRSVNNQNITNNAIRLKFQSYGWGDPLYQRLEAAFANKAGPDIIIGEVMMPAYIQRGLLVPFPEELETYIRENIDPVAYKALEYNGDIYGVATCPSTNVLMWNKDVLRRAKVDEKYLENPPATWEEFLSVAKQIHDSGVAMAGGWTCGPEDGSYLRNSPFNFMANGGFADEDGKPIYSAQGNAEALKFVAELKQYNIKDMLAVSSSEALFQQFCNGKIAYLVEGSWQATYASNMGVDFGYGKLPSPTGTEKDNVAIGAAYFAVPAYSKNADDAFKVIETLLSEDAQMQYLKGDMRPCVRKSLEKLPNYAELCPNQYKAHQIIKESVFHALPAYPDNHTKIWNEYGMVLQKVASNNGPTDLEGIQSLLNEAQTAVLKYFN